MAEIVILFECYCADDLRDSVDDWGYEVRIVGLQMHTKFMVLICAGKSPLANRRFQWVEVLKYVRLWVGSLGLQIWTRCGLL
jgi:hypothetical protein